MWAVLVASVGCYVSHYCISPIQNKRHAPLSPHVALLVAIDFISHPQKPLAGIISALSGSSSINEATNGLSYAISGCADCVL